MSRRATLHKPSPLKASVSIIRWLNTEVCDSGKMPGTVQLPPPLIGSTLSPKINPHLLCSRPGKNVANAEMRPVARERPL